MINDNGNQFRLAHFSSVFNFYLNKMTLYGECLKAANKKAKKAED